jgi:hypothetical protein
MSLNRKLHQIRGYSIVTEFQYPPIPYRNMDWVAFIDGEEELGEYGYGATEEEAISDLIDLLESK